MMEPGRYAIEPLAAVLGKTEWTKPGHRVHDRQQRESFDDAGIGYCPDREDEQMSIDEFAGLLGCGRDAVYAYRKHGLTSRQADHYAVNVAGKHPAQIWPEWFRQAHIAADLNGLDVPDMHEADMQPDVQPPGCGTCQPDGVAGAG